MTRVPAAPAIPQQALRAVVEQFAQLVESHEDGSVPIPGSQWTVRDAAVHLAGANHRHIAYVSGAGRPTATLEKRHFDTRTREQIGENTEQDLKVLAGQIREGFDQLAAITTTVRADQPIAYHAGLRLSVAGLSGILLGEYLLHGYDLAAALGHPWPIDPGHAVLALGAYRTALPALFQPQAAAGLRATYRVDIAGMDPFYARIADGHYEEYPDAPGADCVVSADPVTMLLVQAGRLTQWAAIALGRFTFSGDLPQIGPRFLDSFLFP